MTACEDNNKTASPDLVLLVSSSSCSISLYPSVPLRPAPLSPFPQTLEQQQQVVREIFAIVSKRSDHVCNFVEGEGTLWGADTKIIYRHYATLYIAFVVDGSESELGILDLIQVFVEALDKSFQNVCELHLIFHSDQVRGGVQGMSCLICHPLDS